MFKPKFSNLLASTRETALQLTLCRMFHHSVFTSEIPANHARLLIVGLLSKTNNSCPLSSDVTAFWIFWMLSSAFISENSLYDLSSATRTAEIQTLIVNSFALFSIRTSGRIYLKFLPKENSDFHVLKEVNLPLFFLKLHTFSLETNLQKLDVIMRTWPYKNSLFFIRSLKTQGTASALSRMSCV